MCSTELEAAHFVVSVGTNVKSVAGQRFATDQAIAEAKIGHFGQMNMSLDELVHEHSNSLGVNGSSSIETVTKRLSELLRRETLAQAKVIQNVINSNGTVYVLVSVAPWF